jgi:hypothetical protein
MKKIGVLLTIVAVIWITFSCVRTKQCCKRDFRGLECVSRCDYEVCPVGYPIEQR